MKSIKEWFIFCVLFILVYFKPNYSYSQNIKDLREIGNYVQIFYNTLNDYQNGVTLNGYTRISIKFRYDGSSGWELRLFTNSAEIEYEGGPTGNLDLTALTITPTIISTTDPTITINGSYSLVQGPFDPSKPEQVLVSGKGGTVGTNPPIEVEISITYSMGNMLNTPPGLYFITLQFLLVEKL